MKFIKKGGIILGRQSRKGNGLSSPEASVNEAASAEAVTTAADTKTSKESRSARNKKKKKKKHILLKILAGLVCLGLVERIAGGTYVMNS